MLNHTLVFGYDLGKWPKGKDLPPPAIKEGKVVHRMDCYIAAMHALAITTNHGTKNGLAAACYLRPDAGDYNLQTWAIILQAICGGTVDIKRNIITKFEVMGLGVAEATKVGGYTGFILKPNADARKVIAEAFRQNELRLPLHFKK